MKFIYTVLAFFLTMFWLHAQNCTELFLSEYVEGSGNNRALEIYNPTNQPIDLSTYSVGRFANGATSYTGIMIPAGHIIQPYSTFVIVLDKRDSLGTGLEVPVWNGWQNWGPCIDNLTGNVIINSQGDTVYCVPYNSTIGAFEYGNTYHEFLDLQKRADIFLCPVYNVNNAMYFNGDDAAVLVKGLSINPDGSNIIDVVGVIGEQPPSGSWLDHNGNWLTMNRTLVRKPDVTGGIGPIITGLDTFNYSQWTVFPNNTFTNLGWHDCVCETGVNTDNPAISHSLAVFPNPVTNGLVHLQTEEVVKSVRLYNMLGQQLHYAELEYQRVSPYWRIPEGMAAGVYILQVTFEHGGSATARIAVQ